MISPSISGTGVITYAENIGVMAATKIYCTAVFVMAALIAIILGFSPKFGTVIQAIPLPVIGGVSIVVSGLIAAGCAKIWVVTGSNSPTTAACWWPRSRWCWAPATSGLG